MALNKLFEIQAELLERQSNFIKDQETQLARNERSIGRFEATLGGQERVIDRQQDTIARFIGAFERNQPSQASLPSSARLAEPVDWNRSSVVPFHSNERWENEPSLFVQDDDDLENEESPVLKRERSDRH
ncbi:hypothetical protein CDV31_004652 [Fusarium ambrosium]|uniref:Uncharacterized protein n=1 Tax=Fusarium ambrosium TaxID=131363 RepID=A0A428UPC7_9HYPO|nr:hypothetical protein CDV31_004652 [Fusarium ambrosium]